MIRRTFDATFLNSVANHSEVRPWLGGVGPIDLGPTLANPVNFGLVAEGGGFVLTAHGDGVYEVHSLFLPDARKGTVRAMRDGMDYMFCRTDCRRIVTKVPDGNKPAAGLCKAGGFRELWHRDGCWNGKGLSHQAFDIEDWAAREPSLGADGEWLHAKFEEARKASGAEWPEHAEDKFHDMASGAAVRMVRAGNAEKAVGFYNRWAALAGYPGITLIQSCPVVIDMSAGPATLIIEYRDGDMEVLLCR